MCNRAFSRRRNENRDQSPQKLSVEHRNACVSPRTVASRQPDWPGGNCTSTQLSVFAGSAGRAEPGFQYFSVPCRWNRSAANFTGRFRTTRYCRLLPSFPRTASHGCPACSPSVAMMPALKSLSTALPSAHALQASKSMSAALIGTIRHRDSYSCPYEKPQIASGSHVKSPQDQKCGISTSRPDRADSSAAKTTATAMPPSSSDGYIPTPSRTAL